MNLFIIAREIPYKVLWELIEKQWPVLWLGQRKRNNGVLLARSFAKEMIVEHLK